MSICIFIHTYKCNSCTQVHTSECVSVIFVWLCMHLVGVHAHTCMMHICIHKQMRIYILIIKAYEMDAHACFMHVHA